MRNLSRVLSSSIERLKRRRRNQRSAGNRMRSNAAQIASALMIRASQKGRVTVDVTKSPGPSIVARIERERNPARRASVESDPGLRFALSGLPDGALSALRRLPRVHKAFED